MEEKDEQIVVSAPVTPNKKGAAGKIVALAICCTLAGGILGAGGVIAFNFLRGPGGMRPDDFGRGDRIENQIDDNDSNDSSDKSQNSQNGQMPPMQGQQGQQYQQGQTGNGNPPQMPNGQMPNGQTTDGNNQAPLTSTDSNN